MWGDFILRYGSGEQINQNPYTRIKIAVAQPLNDIVRQCDSPVELEFWSSVVTI
jgi:hypothetical protein